MIAWNKIESDFRAKAINVLILLVVADSIRFFLIIGLPLVEFDLAYEVFIPVVHWGIDIIIGVFIIYWMRGYKWRSLPFGFLTVMAPVIGGIFYLLATFKNARKI